MDLDSVVDLANHANDEIGKFKFEVILSPKKLQRDDYLLDALNWGSILYDDADDLEKVPDDKSYREPLRYPHHPFYKDEF